MENENRYKRRVPTRREDCPWCGNEVVAKANGEHQKCKWCKRLFKVSNTKRKGGWIWNLECVDFPEPQDKFAMSMSGLEDDRGPAGLRKYEDYYGDE